MSKSQSPFSVKRTITWGDCDPAGIVYTPRVFDCVVEAIEAWYRDIVGTTWQEINRQGTMGVPWVRAECDFKSAPGPGDVLDMTVRIARLGRSSVRFVVDGHNADGTECFRATMTSCFVAKPAYAAIPVPEELRQRMAAYETAGGGL